MATLNPRTRTFFLVFLGAVIALILWNVFSTVLSKRTASNAERTAQPAGIYSPGAAETKLFSDKVFFPALVNQDKTVVGLLTHGTTFYSLDLSTKKQTQVYPDPIDYAPTEVAYAPDGSGAVIHTAETNFTDKPGAATTYYDFINKTKDELDPKIHSVHTLSDGRMVYLFTDGAKTSLAIAKLDGTGFSTILDSISVPNATLSIVNDNAVVISNGATISKDSPATDYSVVTVDIAKKQATTLKLTGAFAPSMSPDGKTLAYLALDKDSLPRIHLYTLTTDTDLATDISSLPGTYAWRANNALLAAASTNPDPADLADGFQLNGSTQVLNVDLAGKKTSVDTVLGTPAIERVLLSKDGKTIFDTRVDTLYTSQLK